MKNKEIYYYDHEDKANMLGISAFIKKKSHRSSLPPLPLKEWMRSQIYTR